MKESPLTFAVTVQFLSMTLVHSDVAATSQSTPCSLCLDGEHVTKRTRPVGFLNVTAENCGDLETFATYYPSESHACNTLHSLETYCGCPAKNDEEASAVCHMCSNEGVLKEPNKSLRDDNVLLSDLFPVGAVTKDFDVTCSFLSDIWTVSDAASDQCTMRQERFRELCDCMEAFSDNESPTNTHIPDDGDSETSCSLCPNGEPVPMPERSLQQYSVPASTCGELETILALMSASDQQCDAMHVYGHLCGCSAPSRPGTCSVCPNGDPIQYPNRRITWFEGSLNSMARIFHPYAHEMTCELMEAVSLYEPSSDPEFICLAVQLQSGYCGCLPDWRQRFLTWAYRISGAFSLVGSTLIIYHILVKVKVRGTSYHQLLAGMSVFDCIRSTAYILSDIMVPEDGGFPAPHGNATTCTIQGFMIQFGLVSIFYNLFLACYFFLVIKYNWKESQFKAYLKHVHILLVVFGLLLATPAIPYYGPKFGLCHMNFEPFKANSWRAVTSFFAAPVAFVTIGVSVLISAICVRIYSMQKASKKWSMTKSMELSRRVFWQSFNYVAAFYITIPFVLLSYYIKFSQKGSSFWIFAVAAVMAPAHGLMNALVYFKKSSQTDAFSELVRQNAQRISKRMSFMVRRTSSELGRRSSACTGEMTDSPLAPFRIEDALQQSKGSLNANILEVKEHAGTYHTQSRFSSYSEILEASFADSIEVSIEVSRAGDEDNLSPRHSNSSLTRGDSSMQILGSRLLQPPLPPRIDLLDDNASTGPQEDMEDTSLVDEPQDPDSTDAFEAMMEYWRLNFLGEEPPKELQRHLSELSDSAGTERLFFGRRKSSKMTEHQAWQIAFQPRLPATILQSIQTTAAKFTQKAQDPLDLPKKIPSQVLRGIRESGKDNQTGQTKSLIQKVVPRAILNSIRSRPSSSVPKHEKRAMPREILEGIKTNRTVSLTPSPSSPVPTELLRTIKSLEPPTRHSVEETRVPAKILDDIRKKGANRDAQPLFQRRLPSSLDEDVSMDDIEEDPGPYGLEDPDLEEFEAHDHCPIDMMYRSMSISMDSQSGDDSDSSGFIETMCPMRPDIHTDIILDV